MTNLVSKSTEGKKKIQEWSKEIRANGITKRLRVKEIENGFLLTLSKYGEVKEGNKYKYIDESKEIYSKTNPLSELDVVSDEFNVDSILESIEDDNKLTV